MRSLLCAIAAVRARLKRLAAPAIYAPCTRAPWRIALQARRACILAHLAPSAKKLGRGGFAAAASDNMILLQILVDISQGKYDASSVKEKQQLARVASVVKDSFFLSHLWTLDSDHITCDKAAVDIRSAVKECLDHANILTYEYRQKVIVQMDRNVQVFQCAQNLLEASRSIMREEREGKAESAMVRAEAALAKAELRVTEAESALFKVKMRIHEKHHCDYMESGDDYGERERNYRKRAREGDEDAAAYFAERAAILAGKFDARFEATMMDTSLLE